MWGKTFGRDALLEWLAAELEVLALSWIKDGYTVRTWIVRGPEAGKVFGYGLSIFDYVTV